MRMTALTGMEHVRLSVAAFLGQVIWSDDCSWVVRKSVESIRTMMLTATNRIGDKINLKQPHYLHD
jgi:hypothetical protein